MININGSTRFLAVIGDPVSHSLSPAMHNLAISYLGINYCYLMFHVEHRHLPTALAGFRVTGMLGINATIPHKEALLPLMDQLDPMARLIGAVNTVHFQDDGIAKGYNTDAPGYLAALGELAKDGGHGEIPAGLRVILLGAGGAARGVLAALGSIAPRSLVIANRTPERALRLAQEFTPHLDPCPLTSAPLSLPDLPLESCDLLINTTSLGMHGEWPESAELARLPDKALVSDIVYGKKESPLLVAARKKGLKVQNGLPMLIHQGALAFKIWTGCDMPVEKVREHLQTL